MNLLGGIPESLPQELIEVLVHGDNVTVERIVSRGHTTPEGKWYDQDRDEWILLLSGAATLKIFEQEKRVQLAAGDSLLLPAHQRHRVEWTDPYENTVWIAVYFVNKSG